MQQDYYFGNALVSQKNRSRGFGKKLLMLLLFILGLLIGLSVINKKGGQSRNLVSPVGNQVTQIPAQVKDSPVLGELIKLNFNFSDEGLSRIISAKLKAEPGEYGIVVEGLNPGSKKRFYYNEHKVMPSASLYKLFLIAAALRAIENGELTKDSIISVPEEHLINVLGSKEFGYEDTEGDNITYSVSETLTRIAGISDNYASIMLAEKLGWDKVQHEAGAIGAKDTSIKSPITTTPSDIALFFQKLYSKEVVSPQASDEIIDLLSKAQINNRIPEKLPVGLKIAHKTGELAGIRHDAGIVFLAGNPYLIVLMSQDLEGEDDGVELLSGISQGVYDFFANGVQSAP